MMGAWRFRGLVLLGLALLATGTFLAWQREPFAGYLLERHGVVSALHDPGWPAFEAGLRVGDRVTARDIMADGRTRLAVRRGESPTEIIFREVPLTQAARWRFFLPWLGLGLLLGSLGLGIGAIRPHHPGARSLGDFTFVVALFSLTNLESVTTRHTWLINLLALGATPALALDLARRVHLPDGGGPGHPPVKSLLAGMALALWGGLDAEAAAWAYPGLLLGASLGLLALPVLAIGRFLDPLARAHERRRSVTFAAGAALSLLPTVVTGTGGLAGGGPPAGFAATMLLFPLTLGVLLVRDELFGIDSRSRRMLAHLLATAALVGLQALLLTIWGHAAGPWPSVLASLAVALGLQPLASRLRTLLDKLFDQMPYDPQQALDRFHEAARSCPDPTSLDQLRARILEETVVPVEPIAPSVGPLPRGMPGPRRSGQPWGTRDLKFLADLDRAHALWGEHLALVAAHVRQERVDRELALARQLQSAWLGPPPPPSPDLEIAVRCLPALEVGGDFAEVHRRPDGLWLVAVGDVSGKGVPAALLMVATLTLLRARADGPAGPAELLEELGTLLHRQRPSPSMFVTMSIGLLDPHHGLMRTASAGQQEPWIDNLPPGPSGPALGWLEGHRPPEHVRQLCPGTRIIWATDGLADGLAHRGLGAVGVALDKIPDLPAEAVADQLVHEARGPEHSPAIDDLTLVVLRWRPSPEPET